MESSLVRTPHTTLRISPKQIRYNRGTTSNPVDQKQRLKLCPDRTDPTTASYWAKLTFSISEPIKLVTWFGRLSNRFTWGRHSPSARSYSCRREGSSMDSKVFTLANLDAVSCELALVSNGRDSGARRENRLNSRFPKCDRAAANSSHYASMSRLYKATIQVT